MRIDLNYLSFLYYKKYKDDIIHLLMESYSTHQNFELKLSIIEDFEKININRSSMMIDCPELSYNGRCLIVNTSDTKNSDNCRVLIGLKYSHSNEGVVHTYINYRLNSKGELASVIYNSFELHDESSEEDNGRLCILSNYNEDNLQSILSSDKLMNIPDELIPMDLL